MKLCKAMFLTGSIAAVLLGSGCVKLWQESLDIKTYMIEPDREAEIVKDSVAGKLWIDTVHVLPPYNIRSMILRENDVEFFTSYYTELILSPGENFRNAFYNWYSASGIFEEVSVLERKGMSHRLIASVMDFYGNRVASEAVLRIKITVINETDADSSVLLHKEYIERVKLDEQSPEHLIRAYNEALSAILRANEEDVLRALK